MSKENGLVLDVEQKPKKLKEWLAFAIQHVLAMLVACITVPLITGLPVAATIVSAGIGTIIYLLFTKFKSPVFLSSSFAYLTPMGLALEVGLINGVVGNNYLALILGMVMVGIIYVIVALIIKFVGTKWLDKVLPPILVGSIIMVIGLSLSSSAVNNLCNIASSSANYNLIHIVCGLVAMFATALASHYGKKMVKLIPFIIGMGSGYVVALIFSLIGYATDKTILQVIDFTPFKNIFGEGNVTFASFFNYKLFIPNDEESFIFLRFKEISAFDWAKIGQIALLFVPVALVTICEHIGDHENLGNIINRDLLNNEPGMKRTLMGDGVATAVSGALCGAANTTYGENVAVVGMTRIASVKVVLLAAIFSILFGFFTPFTAFLQTIPSCVTGGVSLILYGFIASSGVKMLLKEKIDLDVNKNIFIVSVVLVTGIGGLTIKWATKGGTDITITSIAVAIILGILLNCILREPKPKIESVKEETISSEDKENGK